jgi:hypothetical protein
VLPAFIVLYIFPMPPSAHGGQLFVFYVRPPRIVRFIAIAHASLVLSLVGWLSWAKFTKGSDLGSWLWLYVALFAVIALTLRLGFPPNKVLPKLQVQRDAVGFVPGRLARRLYAEPTVEAPLTDKSKEILVCHSFLEEFPNGYQVIVRAKDGSESEVRVERLTLSGAEQCTQLSDGIALATGLPVRLITRRRLANGTIQEGPWAPKSPNENSAKAVAAIAIGATPYVGGLIIGLLIPRPSVVVGTGFILWFGHVLVGLVLGKSSSPRSSYSTLYWLATIFTFGAAYAFTYALVAVVFRIH